MNDIKVENWPLDRLIPYAKNPRKNDEVVDQMCAAIEEFSFRIPIIAKSDGTVIDGHLRLKAAKKLGLCTVPVVLADDLTDTQIKAFRLLVNQSANWADWDEELLAQEIQNLDALDFDLNLLGFDEKALDALLEPVADDGNTDEDDVPEENEKVISKSGDLWLLGKHRLLCGDATQMDDVEKVLDDQSRF